MFHAWSQLSSKIIINYIVLDVHIINKFGLEKNKIRSRSDKYRETKERDRTPEYIKSKNKISILKIKK